MMTGRHILVVDDDTLMREFVEESLQRLGHRVVTARGGEEAAAMLNEVTFDAVVTDLKMTPVDGVEVVRRVKAVSEETPCIVMTAYGTIETAVDAMKEGAEDYILKPFSPDELELTVSRALEHTRIRRENAYLRESTGTTPAKTEMIGRSPAIAEVQSQIEKVAASNATALVRGPSGTGKELVARAIHALSPRADGPFIKVNCAALSAGLLESELFGHEKGAFTGADNRKIGRFELADGGTLLLDEVSEMGIELQPKLLRALQEKEIDRVGGAQPIQVDTRIIATTNRDLEESVKKGEFREDLYFRLSVVPIQLPALSKRKDDVPLLMDHFLERFKRENGREKLRYSAEARRLLESYSWPGNVRELQNAIERAVVLASSDTLGPEDFPLSGSRLTRNGHGGIEPGMTVAQVERALIERTLEHCNENRTRAAELLGISVRTLRNKLKEYRESAGTDDA